MAKGQTHYYALAHCVGKLVRIIWQTKTDEVEFNFDPQISIAILIGF